MGTAVIVPKVCVREPSSGGRRAAASRAGVCRLMGALWGGSTPPSPPLRCAVTIAMGALAGTTEMARFCAGLPPGLPPLPPGALSRAGTPPPPPSPPPGLALPLAPLPTSRAAGRLRTVSFCRGREGERGRGAIVTGTRKSRGPTARPAVSEGGCRRGGERGWPGQGLWSGVLWLSASWPCPKRRPSPFLPPLKLSFFTALLSGCSRAVPLVCNTNTLVTI